MSLVAQATFHTAAYEATPVAQGTPYILAVWAFLITKYMLFSSFHFL